MKSNQNTTATTYGPAELHRAKALLEDEAWNAGELTWTAQADYYRMALAQATPGTARHRAAELCLEWAQDAADWS